MLPTSNLKHFQLVLVQPIGVLLVKTKNGSDFCQLPFEIMEKKQESGIKQESAVSRAFF